MRLRTRLLAVLVPAFLLLVALLAGLAYARSRAVLLTEIGQEAFRTVQARAGELDVRFAASRQAAEALAAAAEAGGILERRGDPARALLRQTLSRQEGIYGCALALDPKEGGPFAPYVFRERGTLASRDLSEPGYNYPLQPWFRSALAADRGAWSEPYFDRGGGEVLMTTYATPLRRGGQAAGVATVDLALEGLVVQVRRLALGSGAYAFLCTPGGRLVGHPTHGLLSGESLSQMLRHSPALAPLAAAAATQESDHLELEDPFRGGRSWAFEAPLPASGWRLIVLQPTREVLRPLDRLKLHFALLAGGAVLLSILLSYAIAASITAPLAALARQAARYAEGDYQTRLEASTGSQEMQELSRTFNTLGRVIQEQMADVAREAAAREGYHQELLLAARLQQDILPHHDPPVPAMAPWIDIYGLMEPAKEVGGDFFDVFPLEGGRLGFAVGDVSDKGAPAALFMALARGLVRDLAQRGHSPAEVLRRANHSLAGDTPSSMFITLLYGEWDAATGRTLLASAGHPDPVRRRGVGAAEPISMGRALPLGGLRGTRYETREIELLPGDLLLLYSDGLTEAEDRERRPFGFEGLRRALEAAAEGSSRSLAESTREAVRNHRGDEPPFDDLTLLVLRPLALDPAQVRTFPERALHLELPALTTSLPVLAQTVETFARQERLGPEDLDHLLLAVDEVATNAILHAGGAFLRVDLMPLEDGIQATVTDRGRPFDFDARVQNDPGPITTDSEPGGLGLFLTRKVVEECRYEPGTPEGNRVVLVKRRSPAAER